MMTKKIIAENFIVQKGKLLVRKSILKKFFSDYIDFGLSTKNSFVPLEIISSDIWSSRIIQTHLYIMQVLFSNGKRDLKMLEILRCQISIDIKEAIKLAEHAGQQLNDFDNLRYRISVALSLHYNNCGEKIIDYLREELLQQIPKIDSDDRIPLRSKEKFKTYCDQFIKGNGKKEIKLLIKNKVTCATFKDYKYKLWWKKTYVKKPPPKHIN